MPKARRDAAAKRPCDLASEQDAAKRTAEDSEEETKRTTEEGASQDEPPTFNEQVHEYLVYAAVVSFICDHLRGMKEFEWIFPKHCAAFFALNFWPFSIESFCWIWAPYLIQNYFTDGFIFGRVFKCLNVVLRDGGF